MNSIAMYVLLSALSLEPLTERLSSLEYLTGNFLQTDYWALTLDSEISTGTLHLANPNLFLLEYDDIPGRVTGCTGEQVFTVDPEFQEILVYTGSPTGFLHILSSSGEGLDTSNCIENGDSLIIVLTGEFDGGISEITAGYTLSDSLPFFLSTVDSNGNSTAWELHNLSTSDSSPDIFSIPQLPGYALVDAGNF
jgi:outer membrane lipoprotein-sorting protein